jgi:uncharacterized protein involved in exopolysaccharide biosynthesis
MSEKTSDIEGQEISLSELLLIFYKRKFLILFFVVISIFLASTYLRFAEYSYSVELSVTAVPKLGSSQGAGKAFQNLSITNLLGINKNNGNKDYILYSEIIFQPSLAYELSKNKKLMQSVFSSEWNSETNQWMIPNKNFFNYVKNLIKTTLGVPIYEKSKPNFQRLMKFINENVSVSNNPTTNITTLSIQTTNVKMGKFLLEQIHLKADNILRLKSKKRTDENLKFLVEQLNKTTSNDLRTTIIQNISEQRKIKMMVETNLSFVAEPFGSVYSSERPTKPNPKIILILFSSLGLLFSIIFIFFKNVIK